MFKLIFKNFTIKKEFMDSTSFVKNIDSLTNLFNKSLESIKKTNLFLEQYPEFLTVFSKISGLDFQTAFAINSIYIKNVKPLAFGILAPIVNKNLLVLDKIEYFESIFFTPAYLFFISLLSASFLFFTNQPVPIVDQDGVISISARIQECDKNLSLRFVLDKLNNNLTLPAILILKDSIVQIPKSFDLITNYFMAYEDIVQNKLKAIENQQNTRSRQIQIIESWKIIINEKEKIEETLQSLRDF